MKTPRELILERHQSAEAKLKAIRAEDLAACARSAAEPARQPRPAFDLLAAARSFWQDAFWPWRRAWIGMATMWVFILAFSLAVRETPKTASTKPIGPDPEVLAVLQEQKQLLTQLLGPGAPPLVSRVRTPGPRSAAEPPVGLGRPTGVRPSSGAATSASSGLLELASVVGSSELAAPEDGRTPAQSPVVVALARSAPAIFAQA